MKFNKIFITKVTLTCSCRLRTI